MELIFAFINHQYSFIKSSKFKIGIFVSFWTVINFENCNYGVGGISLHYDNCFFRKWNK
jgi:hypothetical protein